MTGDDLDRLREQHPGWHIEAVWVPATSGPGATILTAVKGETILAAWNVIMLSQQIEQAEATEAGR
jgi:hypothetical protein